MLASIANKYSSVPMKLMLYTLKSKLKLGSKGGMDEVIKMIDDMVVLLGKQQTEDDDAKESCREEFDIAEDEEKAAKTKLEQLSQLRPSNKTPSRASWRRSVS